MTPPPQNQLFDRGPVVCLGGFESKKSKGLKSRRSRRNDSQPGDSASSSSTSRPVWTTSEFSDRGLYPGEAHPAPANVKAKTTHIKNLLMGSLPGGTISGAGRRSRSSPTSSLGRRG